jgi:hypothetical protein
MQLLSSKAQAANNILKFASLPSNPITVSQYVVSVTHFATPTSRPTSQPSASCKPGFYVASNNICTKCEVGTMTDTYHDTACYDCPAGTFSNDIACESCPGYFHLLSLTLALILTLLLLSSNDQLAGSFSLPKSTSCQLCAINYYSNAGSAACTICPGNIIIITLFLSPLLS